MQSSSPWEWTLVLNNKYWRSICFWDVSESQPSSILIATPLNHTTGIYYPLLVFVLLIWLDEQAHKGTPRSHGRRRRRRPGRRLIETKVDCAMWERRHANCCYSQSEAHWREPDDASGVKPCHILHHVVLIHSIIPVIKFAPLFQTAWIYFFPSVLFFFSSSHPLCSPPLVFPARLAPRRCSN